MAAQEPTEGGVTGGVFWLGPSAEQTVRDVTAAYDRLKAASFGPAAESESDEVEPVAGVDAARTFVIDAEGWLRPIAQATRQDPRLYDAWLTGRAVSVCRYLAAAGGGGAHEVREGCVCGVHSYVSAQEVARQYPRQAWACVAVVDPEGRAVQASRGQKSQAATLTAVWVRDEARRALVARRYPQAVVFDAVADLLEAYPDVDDGTGTEFWDREFVHTLAAVIDALVGVHLTEWQAGFLKAQLSAKGAGDALRGLMAGVPVVVNYPMPWVMP